MLCQTVSPHQLERQNELETKKWVVKTLNNVDTSAICTELRSEIKNKMPNFTTRGLKKT